jgi:hypothetical protein
VIWVGETDSGVTGIPETSIVENGRNPAPVRVTAPPSGPISGATPVIARAGKSAMVVVLAALTPPNWFGAAGSKLTKAAETWMPIRLGSGGSAIAANAAPLGSANPEKPENTFGKTAP